MKRYTLYILCCIFAVVAVGCNSTGCIDNKSALPLAGFYSYETLQPITLNSVSVGAKGAPNDSLLLNNSSAQSLYMPFNIGENITKFFIRYNQNGSVEEGSAPTDTVTFIYDRVPYFASEECGAMYSYEVTEVTFTRLMIDSVALTRKLITNADRESIQIFFRTKTADDDDTQKE